MIDIQGSGIVKFYGGLTVFENASFDVIRGEKVGIIGSNGSGKTTLFKIITGLEEIDGGILSLRKDITLAYQPQIPEFPDHMTVEEVLQSAFSGLLELKRELRRLENQMKDVGEDDLKQIMTVYGSLQHEFDVKGGYSIETKIKKICSGLFREASLEHRSFNSLSGGEKTTVMLARLLLQEADVILLDEPTNHLDIEATEWLEDYLVAFPGTALIISHDRYFLDRVTTKILDVENADITAYPGNYSACVQEKERRIQAQFEAYKDQQKKIKAMREAIVRFREWGTRSDDPRMFKKAFSMEKRIERMIKVERPREKKKIDLTLSIHERSGNQVINLDKVTTSFHDHPVLRAADFTIRFKEIVALIGRNGCGKSTIFRHILGLESPDSGEIRIGSRVVFGHLEQEISFENPDQTILNLVRTALVLHEGEARGVLAKFLFYKDDVFRTIRKLSGGEKVRLKLCLLMHQDNNVLLLDEPSNHLDIDAREQLEEALQDYEGTIVFISHDRFLINKLAHRIVELKNGQCQNFPGNYDYYREKRNELTEQNDTIIAKTDSSKEKGAWRQEKMQSARIRQTEKRIALLETLIEETEEELKCNEQNMLLWATNFEKLSELQHQREELQQKLQAAFHEWESIVDQKDREQ